MFSLGMDVTKFSRLRVESAISRMVFCKLNSPQIRFYKRSSHISNEVARIKPFQICSSRLVRRKRPRDFAIPRFSNLHLARPSMISFETLALRLAYQFSSASTAVRKVRSLTVPSLHRLLSRVLELSYAS